MKYQHSDKPSLSSSPDTFFGKPGNITFALRKGHLVWSKDNELYVDGKKVMDLPEGYKSDKMFHRNLMKLYGEITGADEYENAKKEDLDKLIRGRTSPDRTTFNLWGTPSPEIIKNIIKQVVRYGIIKKQDEYKVSTTGRRGTYTYIFPSDEVFGSTFISPHQAIRKKLYRQLGLESKKLFKALSALLEYLKR